MFKVLVVGFDVGQANHTCTLFRSCSVPVDCEQHPGVLIKKGHPLDNPVVRDAIATKILAPPKGSSAGNLGAALAHITAWKEAAIWPGNGPTLILEEDETPCVARVERTCMLLSNRSVPYFDIFYLNTLRPYGVPNVAAPSDALRVPPHRLRAGELARNVWTGAYALSASGARRLLDILKADTPDLSVPPLLDVWIASKVRNSHLGLSAYVWRVTNDLFLHGDERMSKRLAENGGWEQYYMSYWISALEMLGYSRNGKIEKTPCERADDLAKQQEHLEPQVETTCSSSKLAEVAALQEASSPCVGEGLPMDWNGPRPVKMAMLDDDARVTNGLVAGDLLVPWDAAASPAARWNRTCSRLLPKLVHFIWMGSPVKIKHAERMARYALKNPAWRVMLWVDVPTERQPQSVRDVLQSAAGRTAGPIRLMLISEWMPCFQHGQLLKLKSDPQGRRTNPSNLLRIEIVYLFGGIYTDTDSVADRAFDEYGVLFRHPFGITVIDDVCNCMFGADPGNAMLGFALSAAEKGCTSHGAPCTGGTGPKFWTGVFLAYRPKDIVLFDWSALLFPTENAVTHHTWEGSWNQGHVALTQFCEAVGWSPKPPKDPFAHAAPPSQNKCRRLELGLRWVSDQILAIMALLLGIFSVLKLRHSSTVRDWSYDVIYESEATRSPDKWQPRLRRPVVAGGFTACCLLMIILAMWPQSLAEENAPLVWTNEEVAMHKAFGLHVQHVIERPSTCVPNGTSVISISNPFFAELTTLQVKAMPRCMHPRVAIYCSQSLQEEDVPFRKHCYWGAQDLVVSGDQHLKIIWLKWKLIAQVTKYSDAAFFIDADVVILHNPFPLLERIETPLAMQPESYGNPFSNEDHVSGGQVWLRSHELALVLEQLRTRGNELGQNAVQRYLDEQEQPQHTLLPEQFAGYSCWSHSSQGSFTRNDHVVTYNAHCIESPNEKLAVLRRVFEVNFEKGVTDKGGGGGGGGRKKAHTLYIEVAVVACVAAAVVWRRRPGAAEGLSKSAAEASGSLLGHTPSRGPGIDREHTAAASPTR